MNSSTIKPTRARTEMLQRKDNYVIHPWEMMPSVGQNRRTVVEHGGGIYLTDSDGNRMIDGPGGMWCVNIGHGRREMAEAIAEQIMALDYVSPWGLATAPAALLAEKLAALAPGDLNNAFFTTGGSTAVDSALRFVMFYNNVLGRPEKKQIIARAKGYHGSTYLSASCSGKERDKSYFDFADDLVHHLGDVNPYRRPDGMSLEAFCDAKVQELEDKILELGPDKVAAFIAEPILASGGVIVPPAGYHKRCEEICRRYDILTICDEVVTAFGRLGHFFACEAVFGLQPDIVTCAKGLTSGYQPLGATLISDRVYGQISGESAAKAMFSNGYTYSAHPVACAAALKNIEIMEREDLCGHVRAVGPYLQDRLQELNDIPIVGDVRGLGLMGCVECVASRESKESLTLDYDVGSRIDAHCQKLGLLVRPLIAMCVMSPPLVITKSEIDSLVAILREGIERTMADMRREGLWQG